MQATSRQLEETPLAAAEPICQSPAAAVFASISTLDGVYITGGLLDLTTTTTDGAWTARLTRLDQPGVLATTFFGKRIREVTLSLPGGRQLRARIAATTFLAGAERICDLSGAQPCPD